MCLLLNRTAVSRLVVGKKQKVSKLAYKFQANIQTQ